MNFDSLGPHRAGPSAAITLGGAIMAAILAVASEVSPALAADLAVQPRPGQIFAEDFHEPAPARAPIAPPLIPVWVSNSPRVPGYYGRAGDFHYNNYYGTSPFTIYSRLPYACGFVGLC